MSYEFGYGLSYTTFEYDNFKISENKITPYDKVTVSVDVTNAGDMDGDEIVQVYLKTPDAELLGRPIKRLKGFKRVTIPAGQTKTVDIDINGDDLWYWNKKEKRIEFDQGRYVFEIGASSLDIKGRVEAVMEGQLMPILKTVVAESDKMILKKGETAQTFLSATLQDDSFIDINQADVSYKSNNPSVVEVDKDGKIKALRPGVVTVFADVTYNGSTASSSFPLKITPDLTPATVKINGASLENFKPEIKAYSFIVNKESDIPIVSAKPVSKTTDVEIVQAKGLPGTAIVRFFNKNTVEENVYYLNFDRLSVGDEFNDNRLGSQWGWIRENSEHHSLSTHPGWLTITTEKGDISERSNDAKNLLLQSANNDWTIDTKIIASRIPSQPENAGVVAWQDDSNFVKFMLRAVTKTSRQTGPLPGTLDFLIEENDIARSVASFNLEDVIAENTPLFLRLIKSGSTYTAYYSLDGKNYTELGNAEAMLRDIKVGLIACDGVITQSMTSTFWIDFDTTKPDTPFDVSFDYFRIKNSGLKIK